MAAAIIFVGIAGTAGWRKFKTLTFWRAIKLISAALGFFGIVLLLVNFDVTARARFVDKAKEELLLNYIEAKSFISVTMAATCSRSLEVVHDKSTCWDMKNADGQLSIEDVRTGRHFRPIVNWQKNPEIEEFIKQLNQRIDYMNALMPLPEDRYMLFTDDRRPWLFVIAALLLTIALAGSVGEAAFQLRQSMDASPG
jgi:hypothetical protein